MLNGAISADRNGPGSAPARVDGRKAQEHAVAQVAAKLGVSVGDLESAVTGGRTLQDTAAAKGVTPDEHKTTVHDALAQDLPDVSRPKVGGPTRRAALASGPDEMHGSAGDGDRDGGRRDVEPESK
jgi:hypothetical protein